MGETSPKAYSYIRMSTAAQLQGDSLRRQIELSEKYAAEHGLDLDEELKLQDIGVSAFDGSNIEKGSLGQFLAYAKAGKVAKGSLLLLESFDRLSRANLQSSITLLMDILNLGITIIATSDGKTFIPGQTSFQDLMWTIIVLSRAHEESAQKSQRIKAAWQKKRESAHHKKLTGRCPSWVTLLESKKQFELLHKKVEVIKRIFDEYISGIGADSIARRLNREGIEPLGKSKGWQKSTVQKILHSRSVLGEFQPMQKIEGRRTPVGEPIQNYFPPIIDEETFFAAQGARIVRQVGGGGRKGDKVSNLFSKVAVCGYCNSRMHYLNKGKRGGKFLVCDLVRRGLACKAIAWNYLDFETSFLSFVRELDLQSILEPSSDEKQLREIQANLLSVNGKLAEVKRQGELIFQLLIESANPDVSLRERFHENEEEIKAVRAKKILLESEQDKYLNRQREIETSSRTITPAIMTLQDDSSQDLFKTRMEVSTKIRALVTKVIVYPGQRFVDKLDFEKYKKLINEDSVKGPVKNMMSSLGFKENQWRECVHEITLDEYKERRNFIVIFRDGSWRLVQPKHDCPNEYFISNSSKDSFQVSIDTLPIVSRTVVI